ncbi:TXND3 protein, partial [Pitta sordida]|nr:TXND3 protein [Pitta sordida]
ILFQTVITNQNQWDEMLLTNGVVVIDVYPAWCGPCKAVLSVFRKLKNDFSEDDVLHFAVAEADSIETLKPLRNNCEPRFLFCVNGKIIAMVRGVNAPLIIKKVTELVQEEREIAAGRKERTEVLTNQILKYNLCIFITLTLFLSKSVVIFNFLHFQEVVKYSVGIIKPDDVLQGRVEEIKRKIRNAGFDIKAEEEKMLNEEQIRVFYARKKEQPDFDEFVQFMMSGPCHILVIAKKKTTDDIPHWKELHEASESDSEQPDSASQFIRLGGHVKAESLENICDVQDSVEDASRKLAFFFPNFNANQTEQQIEKTLAIIRPTLLKERRNSIMQRIKDDGFKIAMQKEIILTEEQVCTFYKEHEDQDYFPVLLEQMTSGPTLVLALTRENAVSHWRNLLGPKTLEKACKEKPESLRAQYAVDNVPINQLHGSSTPDDAQKELEFFFPQEQTFALIKPEAAKTHK